MKIKVELRTIKIGDTFRCGKYSPEIKVTGKRWYCELDNKSKVPCQEIKTLKTSDIADSSRVFIEFDDSKCSFAVVVKGAATLNKEYTTLKEAKEHADKCAADPINRFKVSSVTVWQHDNLGDGNCEQVYLAIPNNSK